MISLVVTFVISLLPTTLLCCILWKWNLENGKGEHLAQITICMHKSISWHLFTVFVIYCYHLHMYCSFKETVPDSDSCFIGHYSPVLHYVADNDYICQH